jgi:hypothetical protein
MKTTDFSAHETHLRLLRAEALVTRHPAGFIEDFVFTAISKDER